MNRTDQGAGVVVSIGKVAKEDTLVDSCQIGDGDDQLAQPRQDERKLASKRRRARFM